MKKVAFRTDGGNRLTLIEPETGYEFHCPIRHSDVLGNSHTCNSRCAWFNLNGNTVTCKGDVIAIWKEAEVCADDYMGPEVIKRK